MYLNLQVNVNVKSREMISGEENNVNNNNVHLSNSLFLLEYFITKGEYEQLHQQADISVNV